MEIVNLLVQLFDLFVFLVKDGLIKLLLLSEVTVPNLLQQFASAVRVHSDLVTELAEGREEHRFDLCEPSIGRRV